MSSPSQRNTVQRQKILETIQKSAGPVTVHEILGVAQTQVPHLGVATVYRNVKRLHEAGDVEALLFPDGTTRYEPVGHRHHHHFLCERCQQSFCLDSCPVNQIQLPQGFVAKEHELLVRGICADCGG